jgi:LacI family transcriptional regulator
MRPTVIDLARAAGVSLATVDRVLNGRPGVRARTVDAVNRAIIDIGYVRDVAAANLARSRSYRFLVLLPDGDSQFLQGLAQALEAALPMAQVARMDPVLRRYPAEDPHALAHLLQTDGATADGVAILAAETPVARDGVRALTRAGVPVVTLASDMPDTGRVHFAGFDNRAAGRTAGVLMGRFLGPMGGAVMVVGDRMQSRDTVERRWGFDQVLLRDHPAVEVLPTLETHGRAETLAQVVATTLAARADVRGVYLMASGQRALTEVLQARGLGRRLVYVAHELTPHARWALEAGVMDAVITQNSGHLIRSALRVLRAHVDRVPIDPGQEQIRIDIVLRENLAADLAG